MSPFIRSKKVLVTVAALAAVGGGTAGVGGAFAAQQEDAEATSIVEDFSYPGAAEILAEQNVKLISGDGHILIADCATPPAGDIGLLKVRTTDEAIGQDGIGLVCFKLTGTTGLLHLEVPGVYEIRGDGQRTGTGHDVTASLTNEDGDDITVEVDSDGSTQVGIGADPQAQPTILLELKVTG